MYAQTAVGVVTGRIVLLRSLTHAVLEIGACPGAARVVVEVGYVLRYGILPVAATFP
jgi:hypothetical protein